MQDFIKTLQLLDPTGMSYDQGGALEDHDIYKVVIVVEMQELNYRTFVIAPDQILGIEPGEDKMEVLMEVEFHDHTSIVVTKTKDTFLVQDIHIIPLPPKAEPLLRLGGYEQKLYLDNQARIEVGGDGDPQYFVTISNSVCVAKDEEGNHDFEPVEGEESICFTLFTTENPNDALRVYNEIPLSSKGVCSVTLESHEGTLREKFLEVSKVYKAQTLNHGPG